MTDPIIVYAVVILDEDGTRTATLYHEEVQAREEYVADMMAVEGLSRIEVEDEGVTALVDMSDRTVVGWVSPCEEDPLEIESEGTSSIGPDGRLVMPDEPRILLPPGMQEFLNKYLSQRL